MSLYSVRLCVLSSSRTQCVPHVKICCCYMSTGGPTSNDPSAWRKVVNTIKSFGQGAKLLVGDIRKMVTIKSSMKGFKLSGATPMIRPNDDVTLDNIRFVYKTAADLKRTLPTLVLFCIPFIGYIAPFVALMFPEQLLSSHFWSEQQKNDLMARSLRKRHDSILKIAQTPQSQNIINVLHPAIAAFQSENVTYDSFRETANGVTNSLNTLSNQHLQLLSHCWGVSNSIIPLSWFQRKKLRKHLHYIQTCDWIMLRDSTEDISTDVKNELVKERGPLLYNPDNGHDVILNKWLDMKSTCTDVTDAELFIGHMVLLKPPKDINTV